MNKIFLLICIALTLAGCRKTRLNILSGTYEGTMKLTTSTYNLGSGTTSDTSFESSIVVSKVGNDSIQIDREMFLYSKDNKYSTGGIGYRFEAEFKGRKLYLKRSSGGGTGTAGSTSTYAFEGER